MQRDSLRPDLVTPSQKTPNSRHIFTVTEITQDIKLLLENTFTDVWVEGEVSGLSRISTGTTFFSLKDNQSILKCVMFFSAAAGVKFEIKDGMRLVCFGRIGVYEKDGRYQLYVQQVEPKGIGSLQLALEQLKERLEKEGLFKQERKRPIPYLPATIGLVTSLSGAAIKDILTVLERRFSNVHIIIRPAQVQGEGAKEDIAQAIEELNDFSERRPPSERIKVMIVGRGGGSIEDLWAFNEEMVARAIYTSKIPVISAVGHERDVTIADLVADLRAATPSAAAELIIPKKEELKEALKEAKYSLNHAFLNILQDAQNRQLDYTHRMRLGIENTLKLNTTEFEAAYKKLTLLNPAAQITEHITKIQNLKRQIYVRATHFLQLRQAQFKTAVEKLGSLSPLNILARGYSITFKMPENLIVKEARILKREDIILTKLHKGEVVSKVTEVK